jgi:hypothetical protein
MRTASLLPLLLLGSLAGQPAPAVVIDSGDGRGNTSAPADDPGWRNVGVLGNTTGVYVGNHWVLTAAHNGIRPIRFGERRFEPVQGRVRELVAGGPELEADLQLFQLRERPRLPALRLASQPPRVGTPVVMVGHGLNRSHLRMTWSRDWRIVPLREALYLGYDAAPGRAVRWGTNRIADVDLRMRTGKRVSRCFATAFDGGLPTPHEAQAAAGDSGGPVFAKNEAGAWELIGIMITISQHDEQPFNLIAYGNRTYAVDLHAVRSQIETIVASSPDQDGDGIPDVDDNCARVPNPDQADRAGDGTGDACREADDEGDGPPRAAGAQPSPH